MNFESHERFLSTVNFQNRFYLLTYLNGESIIKIYSFEKDGHTVLTHDLSNFSFYNSNNNSTVLGNLLKKEETEIIEEDIPYSMEIVFKKIKIYPNKDYLRISLDHRLHGTRIINLNLNDSVNSSFFVENIGASDAKKSNSFVNGNRLFQLLVSPEFLVLSVHDLETRKKIVEHSVKKNEDFFFKNSPILQQGNSPYSSPFKNSQTKISSAKEFFRKLSNSEVGIYAFENSGKLDITLGGTKQFIVTPGSNGFTTGASLSSIGTTVAPISWSYGSYTSSRSIFTRLLFDNKTLKHIDKKNQNNVFDRISLKSKYLKNTVLKKKLKLETVLRKEDYFLYGFYNKKEKTYSLMKFEK
ncbi:hypothetical protein [Flagellimonas nanhaiensis]|uniref:hypothetical protein n=1 Tax=Flagellimonas nanhaiensis TaxID=2292706 RepID=UPI0011C0465A|nr:hypothetical protein [Allomuricauda nanhaiensis]